MIECSVFNRLRGVGDVLRVGNFRVTGIMLYALYLMVVVTMISEWYYGLAFVVLFVAGESYAWGKWIGWLTREDDTKEKQYADKTGKSFPYIHYIANRIVNQESNYTRYCQIELALRGFIWWYPVYVLFAFAGLISYTEALVIGVVLGIAFPVACWIGTKIKAEGKVWIVNYSRGWENQELVYGLIQGMCLWYVILKAVYE